MKKILLLIMVMHSICSGAQTISPSLASVWTGATDNDWFNPANWSAGVPGINTNVTIPVGLSNYPTILNNQAYCNDMVIQSDVSSTASLLDNGHLTVNGAANV